MMDNMKMLGALSGLLKNREKIQGMGTRVREKLANTRVVGQAGNGAVKVTALGSMKVESVELSPALGGGIAGDAAARQQVGDLIAEATNNALAQVQRKFKEAIDAETKAMGLEGMGDVAGLGGMLGGQ